MDIKHIIVAITGASGAVYGIRLLEALQATEGIETHLVLSSWAERTIGIETTYSVEEVRALADHLYDYHDLAARISSGSFRTHGMVIAPCSMKSVASITCGYSENLISRAADVMIKEHRTLVLVPRETPLNVIHLENMTKLAQLGVVMLPPVPGFYARPKSIDDIVNHTVGKILDQLGIEHSLFTRWEGC